MLRLLNAQPRAEITVGGDNAYTQAIDELLDLAQNLDLESVPVQIRGALVRAVLLREEIREGTR